MSLWPPHEPICHLWMRDMHNIVHTVATIAKLPEKALKITLICDFNRVVLHQYCMYGFRDRESGLEKGRSWLCQWVGDLVAIQCREEEERGKCVFLPNEIGKNGDLGRLKTWDFSVKITISLYVVKYTENLLQFWTDLILLNKSPNSGRVKIKIAKVTTNTTTRLHTMMDIYGLFWGYWGLNTYIPALFPP